MKMRDSENLDICEPNHSSEILELFITVFIRVNFSS